MTIADELLPKYDVSSAHSIFIAASPSDVYESARTLDLSGSRLTRALFRLRGMPASALTAEGLARIRFKPVLEVPGRGFALGIVGRFWTPSGRLLDFDPKAFAMLSEPGYAKAAWTFEVSESDGGTTLSTATRVLCMDANSRRSFKLYWTFIRPFSGLIRGEALRTVKRSVEGT